MGCCKEQCSLYALGLNHPRKELFYRAQWQSWPWFLYPVYRSLIFLYMFSFTCYMVYAARDLEARFLTYLSNIDYLLLTVYQGYNFALVIGVHWKNFYSHNTNKVETVKNNEPGSLGEIERSEMSTNVESHVTIQNEEHSRHLPWPIKLLWLLRNTSSLVAVCVTIVLYGMVIAIGFYNTDAHAVFMDLNIHLFTTVFVLLDLAISAIPLRILHFIYGTTALILYLIFTVIYFAAAGVVLYPVTDYSRPALSAPVILGFVVLIVLVWMVLFGLYTLRVRIAISTGSETKPEQVATC